jgi:hypothetical protein
MDIVTGDADVQCQKCKQLIEEDNVIAYLSLGLEMLTV